MSSCSAMRRPAALLAVALLSLVASTGVAAAHAKLESMSPPDGSTMAVPPTAVVLRFNEPVGSTGAEVVVKSPSGGNVSTGSPAVVDATVTQALGAMTEAGRYQVDARIVSDDGHPITVSASFTVTHAGHATGQQPAASAPQGGSSSAVVIVAMVLVMLVVVALAIVIVRRGPAPGPQ
ncbi:MAG TPA: copper resistance CopC family protein [Kribbella sp.]|nr:copper resistance CopC family protein [Kribbella sp.]